MPPPACPVEILELRRVLQEQDARLQVQARWNQKAAQLQSLRAANAPPEIIRRLKEEIVADDRYWPDPDSLGGRMVLAWNGSAFERPVRWVDAEGKSETRGPVPPWPGAFHREPEEPRAARSAPARYLQATEAERERLARREVNSWLSSDKMPGDHFAFLLRLPGAYEIRCRERLQRWGWVAGPVSFGLFCWLDWHLLGLIHGVWLPVWTFFTVLLTRETWGKGVKRLLAYTAKTAELREEREGYQRDGRIPLLFQD